MNETELCWIDKLFKTILKQNANESGRTCKIFNFLYLNTPKKQRIESIRKVVMKWMQVREKPKGQVFVTYLFTRTTEIHANTFIARGKKISDHVYFSVERDDIRMEKTKFVMVRWGLEDSVFSWRCRLKS